MKISSSKFKMNHRCYNHRINRCQLIS